MPDRTNSTIFIVDDDDAVRDSLLVLLGNKGYAAVAFESADAFLAAYKPELKGCLLLDIRMPGTDGMAMLKRLGGMKSQLHVIMMTGHGDIPTAVRAMRLGAFDFLEKPFTQDIVIGAIDRALQTSAKTSQDRTMSADVAARLEKLTPREREVMDRLVTGLTNKEVARQLDISPRTIEIHRARIMEKMETPTLSHLVRLALTAGITEGL